MTLKDLYIFKESVKDGFTQSELEDLGLLQHDKAHAGDANGRRIAGLEKALTKFPSTSHAPLWRGMSKFKDDVSVGKILTLRNYTSFSEHRPIAEQFAKSYKTNVLMKLLHPAKGFNYGQWLVDDALEWKEKDPQYYHDIDGDFQVEGAKDEAEWIFPQASSFSVEEISEENGFKILVVKLK